MYEDIPFIEEYKCNIGLRYCYIDVLNVTYPLSYVTLPFQYVNLASFLVNPSCRRMQYYCRKNLWFSLMNWNYYDGEGSNVIKLIPPLPPPSPKEREPAKRSKQMRQTGVRKPVPLLGRG